ncbi:hypothetical protein U9M48_004347 [Paspalum notatum var. saurae]|uniref:SHSP domain-containing protein n=1 Tax=Paspalum notatum var. saurae TaxID=547442 RepID=A0AAQ3SHM5_PASNO
MSSVVARKAPASAAVALAVAVMTTAWLLTTPAAALVPYGRAGDGLWDLLLLDDPFRMLEQSPAPTSVARASAAGPAVALARCDWKETPEAHVITVDVPGVRREDVRVEVEENSRVVRVSGERRRDGEGKEEEGERWHRAERAAGRFWRRFRMPAGADVDRVSARLQDGVLTVTVPKVAGHRGREPRVISVSGSDGDGEGRAEAAAEVEASKAEMLQSFPAAKRGETQLNEDLLSFLCVLQNMHGVPNKIVFGQRDDRAVWYLYKSLEKYPPHTDRISCRCRSLPHLRRKEDGWRSGHPAILVPSIGPSRVQRGAGSRSSIPSSVAADYEGAVAPPSLEHECCKSVRRDSISPSAVVLFAPPSASCTAALILDGGAQGRPRRCATTRRRGFREIHGLESVGTAWRGGKSSGDAHPFFPLQLGAEVLDSGEEFDFNVRQVFYILRGVCRE